MDVDADWRVDLDRWLEPFLTVLNHSARRSMCPLYIAGLIDLGERKSMQPMAARQDGVSYDRLQHFISVGRWDDAPSGPRRRAAVPASSIATPAGSKRAAALAR